MTKGPVPALKIPTFAALFRLDQTASFKATEIRTMDLEADRAAGAGERSQCR